jgi:hypothetical protein
MNLTVLMIVGSSPMWNVDSYDEYIRAELMFDFMGDDVARGQVIKRAKGEDGQPLGTHNANPIHQDVYSSAFRWFSPRT